MAMVAALVTSKNLMDMTEPEVSFVTTALSDLEARGFDRAEILKVLRRLRNRMIDPADREGEATECGEPSARSGTSLMF